MKLSSKQFYGKNPIRVKYQRKMMQLSMKNKTKQNKTSTIIAVPPAMQRNA